MFEKFAEWCAAFFGSPRTFGFTAALILVWIAIAPWMGWQEWNSTIGLAGNTTESTAELLLAIAIQYVCNRSEKRHDATLQRIEELETKILDRLPPKEGNP